MSVELSGALIISMVLNVLLLVLGFFIRLWITRLQADLDSARKAHADHVALFHAYQLQCANNFAQKADISNGRQEMLDGLHKIESKVDRISDKLDKKADKE